MTRRRNRVAPVKVKQTVPAHIAAEAKEAKLETLPPVSRAKYLKQYEAYKTWCISEKTPYLDEESLLVYLRKLTNEDKHVATTIKSHVSMIKACIKAYDGVDIGHYQNVNAYLKNQSKKHKPKKARILTTQQLHAFCTLAPDDEYFLIKVILIVGVIGCCRKSELVYLLMSYVTVTNSSIVIDIPSEVTKNLMKNTFSIVGPFFTIVKRYLDARKHIKHERFFLTYRDGNFINLACGEKTIGGVPKAVAEFLGLPEPERYTSHSIRRSSATVYAESGCTEVELKRHGRWASSSCAFGYLEDTDLMRHKVSNQITHAILPQFAPQNQVINVQYNHVNQISKVMSKPTSLVARKVPKRVNSTVTSAMLQQSASTSAVTSAMLQQSASTSAVTPPPCSNPSGFKLASSLVLQGPTASSDVKGSFPRSSHRYRQDCPYQAVPRRSPFSGTKKDEDEDLSELFDDDFDDEPWSNNNSSSGPIHKSSVPKILSNIVVCPAPATTLTSVGNALLQHPEASLSDQSQLNSLQAFEGSTPQSPSLINDVDPDIFEDMLQQSSDEESSVSVHNNLGKNFLAVAFSHDGHVLQPFLILIDLQPTTHETSLSEDHKQLSQEPPSLMHPELHEVLYSNGLSQGQDLQPPVLVKNLSEIFCYPSEDQLSQKCRRSESYSDLSLHDASQLVKTPPPSDDIKIDEKAASESFTAKGGILHTSVGFGDDHGLKLGKQVYPSDDKKQGKTHFSSVAQHQTDMKGSINDQNISLLPSAPHSSSQRRVKSSAEAFKSSDTSSFGRSDSVVSEESASSIGHDDEELRIGSAVLKFKNCSHINIHLHMHNDR
ncbi:hypothetical protein QAD02_006964 [Eretmocerus hayati]|uniref:Uncharacterized protein n=1 Tax=Eretmocerus hayati TaxID=131215 RepID=A0ACC2N2Q0_9HYME|nr:hypothetical protein QAD02_006964 [Eretmocerus hayati]